MGKKSKILDIGSGTGHHVNMMSQLDSDVLGIDKSAEMVKVSKKQFNENKFQVGDATNSLLFQPKSFTHITCMFFTLYYIKDKRHFFENCYKWLKPKGYLVIHLVNRNKFNPVVYSSIPVKYVPIQKYAPKRITESYVKFNDFKYKSDFKLNNSENHAEFIENIKDDHNGNVRKNVHKYYMETQKKILSYAEHSGFKLMGKIDLAKCNYHDQFLYVLHKDN
jgi:SAM-dependent methyltransferase